MLTEFLKESLDLKSRNIFAIFIHSVKVNGGGGDAIKENEIVLNSIVVSFKRKGSRICFCFVVFLPLELRIKL